MRWNLRGVVAIRNFAFLTQVAVIQFLQERVGHRQLREIIRHKKPKPIMKNDS